MIVLIEFTISFVFFCLVLKKAPLLVLLKKLMFQKGDYRITKSKDVLHLIDFNFAFDDVLWYTWNSKHDKWLLSKCKSWYVWILNIVSLSSVTINFKTTKTDKIQNEKIKKTRCSHQINLIQKNDDWTQFFRK